MEKSSKIFPNLWVHLRIMVQCELLPSHTLSASLEKKIIGVPTAASGLQGVQGTHHGRGRFWPTLYGIVDMVNLLRVMNMIRTSLLEICYFYLKGYIQCFIHFNLCKLSSGHISLMKSNPFHDLISSDSTWMAPERINWGAEGCKNGDIYPKNRLPTFSGNTRFFHVNSDNTRY